MNKILLLCLFVYSILDYIHVDDMLSVYYLPQSDISACMLPSLYLTHSIMTSSKSQSVLGIVSGLYEVSMGVWRTLKQHQSYSYFPTFLKEKGSHVLTLCTLLLV